MGIITMAYVKNMGWLKSLYLAARKLSWKGIIFFLVGAFLLFFFTQQWLIGLVSLNWQTTQGKIVTSQAVACVHKYFPNTYKAKIIYSYFVNGSSYSSDNITFTTDSALIYCGNAEKMMAIYPLGKSVLVYYDPDNPENSVLRPGGTSLMSVGISLAMFIYGIKLFVSESDFTKAKVTKRSLKNRVQVKR
jgi:hypothetical protein